MDCILVDILARANPSLVTDEYCGNGTKSCFVYFMHVCVESLVWVRKDKSSHGGAEHTLPNQSAAVCLVCSRAVFDPDETRCEPTRGNNPVGFYQR